MWEGVLGAVGKNAPFSSPTSDDSTKVTPHESVSYGIWKLPTAWEVFRMQGKLACRKKKNYIKNNKNEFSKIKNVKENVAILLANSM